MSDPALRPATAADADAVTQIVHAAYAKYTERIGKPAGPMLDDYAALIAQGLVTVAELAGRVVGVLVLIDAEDHLLLDNIAIAPDMQGRGLGRRLIAAAEKEAVRRGFAEVRLYTHVTMVENIALYGRLGFVETGRGTAKGYARVFMAKGLDSKRMPKK